MVASDEEDEPQGIDDEDKDAPVDVDGEDVEKKDDSDGPAPKEEEDEENCKLSPGHSARPELPPSLIHLVPYSPETIRHLRRPTRPPPKKLCRLGIWTGSPAQNARERNVSCCLFFLCHMAGDGHRLTKWPPELASSYDDTPHLIPPQ